MVKNKKSVIMGEHTNDDGNTVGVVSADDIIPAMQEFLDELGEKKGHYTAAMTLVLGIGEKGLLDDLELTATGHDNPRAALAIIAAATHGAMEPTIKALCANERYDLVMDVVSEVANAAYTGLIAAVPERDRDILEKMADDMMKNKNKKK